MSERGSLIGPSRNGRSEAVDRGRIWRVAAIAAGVSLVVNLVLWAIARGPFDVSGEFMVLETPIPTIVVTLIGVFAGAGILLLLDRFVARPFTWFLAIGVVFTIVSLLGPIQQESEPGGSTEASVILILMHLATAAITLWLLAMRARER